MANIISFIESQFFDYEEALEEIEFLVPKYLESVECLEEEDRLEAIPGCLRNVEAYWGRLSSLLSGVQNLEEDPSLKTAIVNSQQSELMVLERVYLKINERIHFSEQHWTHAMWCAAESILNRMDIVLDSLGFDQEHEDRMLVQEIKNKNSQKMRKIV